LNLTTAKTVGELAANHPAAARMFEEFGIDYCCGGGNQSLAGFEADLHRHIHLENNILFPRAIEMERAEGRL